MKKLLITILFAATCFVCGPAFGAQVSFGIRIGPPPPPRAVRVLPPSPGPDYVWIDGYYYPVGNHWRWHQGYWTRTPYAGAQWYAPRYENGEYFNGYWGGGHGHLEHNHNWDRYRDRDYHGHNDYDRDHDHDHDNDHH